MTNLLRWPGRKKNRIKHISPFLPDSLPNTWAEPFVGSAVVFSSFRDRFSRAVIADSDPFLVNFLQAVRDFPEVLFKRFKDIGLPFLLLDSQEGRKEYYLFQRERLSLSLPQEEQAPLFLFLNRTSFNGLVRYNKQGKFNTPVGRKNFDIENIKEEIFYLSSLLQGTDIQCTDWRDFDPPIPSFLFLDPPYFNNTPVYWDGNWKEEDWRDFVTWTLNMGKIHSVFLTIGGDVPDWFLSSFEDSSWTTVPTSTVTNISGHVKARKKLQEYFIFNWSL